MPVRHRQRLPADSNITSSSDFSLFQSLHDTGGSPFVQQFVLHEIHISEEPEVTFTEIIQAGVARLRFAKTILRAFSVAGEQIRTLFALRRQKHMCCFIVMYAKVLFKGDD